MDTLARFSRQRRLAGRWLAQASLAAALGAVLGAGLLAAPSPAQAQSPHPDLALQAAHQAFEQGRWDAAFAGYAALADQGHPLAAHRALAMWTEGRARFGRGFAASDEQLARWLRFSACGGHCSDAPEPAPWGC